MQREFKHRHISENTEHKQHYNMATNKTQQRLRTDQRTRVILYAQYM